MRAHEIMPIRVGTTVNQFTIFSGDGFRSDTLAIYTKLMTGFKINTVVIDYDRIIISVAVTFLQVRSLRLLLPQDFENLLAR